MARTILDGIGVKLPAEDVSVVTNDPFQESRGPSENAEPTLMNHIGYPRQKSNPATWAIEEQVVAKQKEIDAMRRKK